jgi:sortase (surface protein transpeptidase)
MITKQKIIRISGLLFLIGTLVLLSQFTGFRPSIPAPLNQSSDNFSPAPTRIKITNLNIDAAVVGLGLNDDHTLQVPKKDGDVGWYVNSPSPGGMGPSIMVGHLDSIRGSAVFWNLKKLQPGDEIIVERADGSSATFKVDRSETFSQNDFPSDQVYGTINYSGLRLITCSGTYSRLSGHYSDNLVVFATLEKIAYK